MAITCEKCGNNMPDDSIFCPKCGAKVETLYCRKCGKPLKAGAVFCTFCGEHQIELTESNVQQSSHIDGDSVSVKEKESPSAERNDFDANTQQLSSKGSPQVPAIQSAQTDSVSPETTKTTYEPIAKSSEPEYVEFSWKYFKNKWWSHFGKWTVVEASVCGNDCSIKTKVGKSETEQELDCSDIRKLSCSGRWSVFWSIIPFAELIWAITLLMTGYGIGYFLAVVVLLAFTMWVCSTDIYHYELRIAKVDGNYIKLISRAKDKDLLFQLQDELLERSGLPMASCIKKKGKPVLICLVLILLASVICCVLYKEVYLSRLEQESGTNHELSSAYSTLDYVTDAAELLTDTQRKELNLRATSLTEKYGLAVRIFTVSSISDYNIEDFAETAFNQYSLGYGPENSMVLLLLNMEYQEFDLMTRGDGNNVFTEYVKESLVDSFLPKLGDSDWYGGFTAYLDGCEEHLSRLGSDSDISAETVVNAGESNSKEVETEVIDMAFYSVILPKSWIDMVYITTDETLESLDVEIQNAITFIEKTNSDAGYGGFLSRIGMYTQEAANDVLENDRFPFDYTLLGTLETTAGKEFSIIAMTMFPDRTHNTEDESLETAYSNAESGLNEVYASICGINGCRYNPQA